MDFRVRLKIVNRLNRIYKNRLTDEWLDEFIKFIDERKNPNPRPKPKWDESKVFLITYGDTIRKKNEAPLRTLHQFSRKYFKGNISTIHILPFFPYSSDDGFSVEDFYEVNHELGDWQDILNLNSDFELMADLVANHASSKGTWFNQFLKGEQPGANFFFSPSDDFDTSKVIRPRSSDLLTEYKTANGSKKVWTTFSADQVDLNYRNPEVLKEMLNVFLFYLANGIRVIRLDAIAFLWKESGTSCMHEEETHEIVCLFREIMDYTYPGAILLTETNVPHYENITYFGLGDEAHLVYQFALPPLILHALHFGSGHYLTQWARELNDPRRNTTYLNFTSSHDGIGVRPLEGLMPDEEKEKMVDNMKAFGARVTTRRLGEKDIPYEINVTFFDALKGTSTGVDEMQTERFLMSQTIMMSLQGVPAFYILNMFGVPNYVEGVQQTGSNRSINRRKFELSELETLLEETPEHKFILNRLIKRINMRNSMIAFSPETQQLVLNLGDNFFGILRKTDRIENSVVCIFNLTNKEKTLRLPAGLMEFCRDALTRELHDPEKLNLRPYQSLWLITRFVA